MSNFIHGRKSCASKKSGHKDDVYYKEIVGGSKKGRE